MKVLLISLFYVRIFPDIMMAEIGMTVYHNNTKHISSSILLFLSLENTCLKTL